jgi:hypothetical protein
MRTMEAGGARISTRKRVSEIRYVAIPLIKAHKGVGGSGVDRNGGA